MDNMTDAEKRKKIEQLKKKIDKVKSEHDYAKAMQLALKLVLNGTYGAFCHPAFTVSNTNIANSITALAREVINFMLDHIENYFYDKWCLDKEIHKLLGVVYIAKHEDGFYLVRKDGKLIDSWARKDDDKGTGINKILEVYNMSSSDFVDNDIPNFEIDGKTYETIHKCFIADFSNVEPIPTEYSIDPIPDSKKFDETRGVRVTPMIIYGDTDSLYISFTPLMQSIGYEGEELKFILHINGLFIKFLFLDFLKEYSEMYHVKNLHDFELETINKSALHLQKKMYINNVVWEDGVFYEDLSHFYPKGVDIVRSSTPTFVRENIWEFIKYLFKNPGNVNIKDILKIMKDLKKQFMMADIEDISMTTSLTNYDQKVIDDNSGVECAKGAHFSIKAAALHNFLLNKNGDYKTKYDLLRGGKIKYYYCKHDMGERFAYMRSFHPTEITTKEGVQVDYDEEFSKTFLSIANRFIEPIGLPVINKRLSVLNSIFSSSKVNLKSKKKAIIEEDIDDDEPKVISSDDLVLIDEINEITQVNQNEIDNVEVSEPETTDDFYSDDFEKEVQKIEKQKEVKNNVEEDDFWS